MTISLDIFSIFLIEATNKTFKLGAVFILFVALDIFLVELRIFPNPKESYLFDQNDFQEIPIDPLFRDQ